MKDKKAIAVFIVVVVLVASFVIVFQLRQSKDAELASPEPTLSEKEIILQSLSAPPGTKSQLQGKERIQVMDSLSASLNTESQLTKEEREEVAEQLSAPPGTKSQL